jgi:hypothetical protein
MLAAGAAGELVGFDANGDLFCDSTDMVYHASTADVGTARSIDLFFDDLPSDDCHGCVLCITDKSRIGQASWTHNLPEEWMHFDAIASDTGFVFPLELSVFITARYPNCRCWYVSACDWTFQNPITVFPSAIGTLTYEVAEEGCIQWVIDGPNTAVMTGTSFGSLYFGGPGETCDTLSCEAVTAAQASSWGSVKALFR